LDADATYRLAAILPGPDADPTPDEPGIDEDDLQTMAGRIDQLLRRPAPRDGRPGAGAGIRVPFAITWRGTIVAVLGADAGEWQRLQDAVGKVFGTATPSWTAIAVQVDGVPDLARSLIELQEGLRVADAIGRRGLIDDLAELGVERLLLSDRELGSVVIERELGPLLADPRMGEELIETLQVYFDSGENRRETARRMHLADRTVGYRLDRAETLLGHGLEGDAGRRLNVALTLRRLEGLRRDH
jgi:sugar diacid utilization regulator